MKHIRRKVPLCVKVGSYCYETMRDCYLWLHRQYDKGCTLKEMITETDWLLPFSWSATNLNIHKTFACNRRNIFPLTLKFWSNNSK